LRQLGALVLVVTVEREAEIALAEARAAVTWILARRTTRRS